MRAHIRAPRHADNRVPLRIARVVQRPVANGRAGDRGSHVRRAIWRESAKAAHQRHVAAAFTRCAPFRTLPVLSAWALSARKSFRRSALHVSRRSALNVSRRSALNVSRRSALNVSASFLWPALNAELPLCWDSPERLHSTSCAYTHRVTHNQRSVSVPHLHRDWAHPCHICTGTGLTRATSVPGLGAPHICTGTGLTPATSALGLRPGSGRRPTRHKSGRRSPGAPSQHTAVSGGTRSLRPDATKRVNDQPAASGTTTRHASKQPQPPRIL
jgi:hypothetical protein